MALEQKLNLRMSQRLIMTPSLQQAIKLLQMTKLELQEEVTQELTENPLLEEVGEGVVETEKPEADEPTAAVEPPGEAPEAEASPGEEKDSFEEIDYEAYFQDYMDMSYSPQFRAESEEQEARPLDAVLSKPQSLSDHLLWQLDMTIVSPRQKEIGRAIIGNLNEDGYLQASPEEIAAMGPYSAEEVELALHLIQEFDPTGVGARDLKECLLIQLAFHDMEGTPAETIVREHMDLLQAHKYRELAQVLECSLEEVMHYVDTIRGLDPKPGKKHHAGSNNYV